LRGAAVDMGWFGLFFGPGGWSALLLNGAVVTISLALSTVPVGFGLGLGLAVLTLSRSRVVRAMCAIYTTFFRGIPDLLTLFIVYFGLQALIDRLSTAFVLSNRIELNAFVAGVIALSVVVAAYSSEVWVSALKSVSKGQIDAAQALGLNRGRTFWLVTWPQLIRVALPGLGNIWMLLLKETSLVSTLALVDLLRAASEASKNTTKPILFYSAAAALYLVFGGLSSFVQTRLEKRANRGFA
jgi:polar amino acid transport system permease protein